MSIIEFRRGEDFKIVVREDPDRLVHSIKIRLSREVVRYLVDSGDLNHAVALMAERAVDDLLDNLD